MTPTVIRTLVLCPIFAGCLIDPSTPDPEGPGSISSAEAVRVIEIPVSASVEYELQITVDNGHQPWRLVPELVACSEIAGRFQLTAQAQLIECNVVQQKSGQAIVLVKPPKNGTLYRVFLERVVRPDGIWTAKRIEVLRKNISIKN